MVEENIHYILKIKNRQFFIWFAEQFLDISRIFGILFVGYSL